MQIALGGSYRAIVSKVDTENLQKDNYSNYKSAFEKPETIVLLLREKLKSNDYADRYIGHIKSISGKKFIGKIIVNIQKDLMILWTFLPVMVWVESWE